MSAAYVPKPTFQFSTQWQSQLVRLLMEDHQFGHAVAKFLEPSMFTNEVLAWAYAEMKQYMGEYSTFPSPMVLLEKANRLDARQRQMYAMGIQAITQQPLLDASWIRDQTIDFIRRNHFVDAMKKTKGLWSEGKITEAYDSMQTAMESIYAINFDPIDEAWFFEELGDRQSHRWRKQSTTTQIGTGLPELDEMMGGGPVKGEMCAWMAYSKVGKSTMLTNHGVVATRGHYANVAHFILEGDKAMIEDRYDTIFSQELYRNVRKGELDARQFEMLQSEYRYLRTKLYIRALVDKWEYNIPDIHSILKDLRNKFGWKADMLIIDYLDLLVGHKPSHHYTDEFASNADAWKSGKTLAQRDDGYVLWTAAQAKKPKIEDFDSKAHELNSTMLSGRYDKIKVADFFGSINATLDERQAGIARLWIEAVRNSPGGKTIKIGVDFSRMTFGLGTPVPDMDGGERAVTTSAQAITPSLGYQQVRPSFLQKP